MIDTYGDRQNPCGFCVEQDEDDPKSKEYLEFSLCGNNTSLFVREVSVEHLTIPSDEEPEPEAAALESPESTTKKPTPAASEETHPPPSRERKRSSNARRMDALNTKRWSGNTYFEEEIRRLRDLQYNKDVKEALRMRRLWKSFQIQLMRDKRRALVKSSGPEWWQEPSSKQIVLATTLRDVIKADFEEEVTGRTRQWLLDLGVTTHLTPLQVRRCMKRSLLEPVDFLLETHAQIVKAQQKVKKKGDLQRPFSVDERLILSAVCVLQLPTLIIMLHYLLPPPEPFPTDKFRMELLYGNLEDETIRYASPYMEPLPFRNKVDFEDWAFGKVCSALLPILIKNDESAREKRKSNKFSELVSLDLKRSLSGGSVHNIPNNRMSVYSACPSIAVLLSYCLSKRNITDSIRVNADEESIRKTFGRRLTILTTGRKQSHAKEEATKPELSDAPVQSSEKSLESDSTPVFRETTPTSSKKDKTSSPNIQVNPEEYAWAQQQQQWQGDYSHWNQGYQYQDPAAYYGAAYYDDQTNYYDNAEQQRYVDQRSNNTSRVKTAETVSSSSKLTLEATHSASEDGAKSFNKEPRTSGSSLHQLQTIWDEIGALPEKEQIQQAMKVLAEMGDPLAQLPGIEKLPPLKRWLELRRGKRRILSKLTKEQLLNLSRAMWKSVHFGNMSTGPHVDITKAEERKLTWDRKKWLEAEIRKEKKTYFADLRQEKVDNARAFFPTMLNHYDYGSKLNRNFRDVYFTYLPAREADLFAYRPWQPSETTNSKN